MGSKQADLRARWCQLVGLAVSLVLLAGALTTLASVDGCSAQPSTQAASAERCMSSCSRVATDGEACLSWAALTPETCVRRFSVAQACCGPGDQPECALTASLAVGVPCICRGADQRGAYVVQGSACKVP